ncbi:Aste57867_17875 [Aphanomyces stellatus]|uniref:Aste57867_17875 protein n=1 Tax=Aphanomyces stellatus TaxID=120398 RepID=A0A485LCA8_9STRA|nr:hypothetical protein As57867_017814 [Aphanomyces stellatus]VFT94618.1 Aste57867_17875 [Aphanomyces stellatus]
MEEVGRIDAVHPTKPAASLRVFCVDGRHPSRDGSLLALLQNREDIVVRSYCPTTSIFPPKEEKSAIALLFVLCVVFVCVAASKLILFTLEFNHEDPFTANVLLAAFAFVALLLASVVDEVFREVRLNSLKQSENGSALAAAVRDFECDVLVGRGYGGDLVLHVLSDAKKYKCSLPSVVLHPASAAQGAFSEPIHPALLVSTCTCDGPMSIDPLGKEGPACDGRRCQNVITVDNLMRMIKNAAHLHRPTT